ncbi:MAG: hypothetical protein AAF970_09980, partial [Bacteroidota bacterium]
AEIERACEPYGYHPLSLSLLAGLIVGDYEQPGDVAVAKRLDVMGDLVQRKHHVLEVAYDRLRPARRTFLSRIACYRSPVAYEALKALRETVEGSAAVLRADLRDLIARGLLQHDKRAGRFDLHPIMRRYAYDRLAAPDRAAAHAQLRDYFAAVPPPDKVTRLEDLAPVIELYHHTVRAGQFDEAYTLFRDRMVKPIYYQFSAYQVQIELLQALFPDGEDHSPSLGDERRQASALNELALAYDLSGQPRRAAPLYERSNAIYEKQGDKRNLAVGLGNMAVLQLITGSMRAAEDNLRRSIALSLDSEDEYREAAGRRELDKLLAYRGAYAESETELEAALKGFEKINEVQSQCVVWAYRSQRELLQLRTTPGSAEAATELARRALELADETARTRFPHERDYVRAHWLLGAAHRIAGALGKAERHLHEALERCRRVNVEFEADIIIDLARLSAARGAADEALRLANEARMIAERCGYVLQGADAHLELARLALARGDNALAKEHAGEALRLATCDGPPDYTYKAAYDEATSLLARLASRGH